MAINWYKLKDGKWGIKSDSALSAGQTVTVTKKDGSTSQATVGRVVWSGQGTWLATVEASGRGRGSRGPGSGVCADCGGPCKSKFRLCWDCKVSLDEDMGIYR